MPPIDITLEMKALDAEKAGMEAENAFLVAGLDLYFKQSQGLAHGQESFRVLAEKYRALKGSAIRAKAEAAADEIGILLSARFISFKQPVTEPEIAAIIERHL